MIAGCLYGVGLGPGDPELMTLKAARILRETSIVAYFSKGGKRGHAHAIAASVLTDAHVEMPLVYPITREYPVSDPRYETLIRNFYEEAGEQIAQRLIAGHNVALLCVGDPFFYGSFMHMYRRLAERFSCKIIPGVTAMSGCWANAKAPITWGDDILTVLPGTLDSSQLAERLRVTDAAVIMKLGSNFACVRAALRDAGLLERAIYIEYGTMQAERILPMAEKTDDHAPYFSLIIVPGMGRRL